MSIIGCWMSAFNGFVCFQEIAGLSVEPCDGEFVVVAVFEIKNTEVLVLLSVNYYLRTYFLRFNWSIGLYFLSTDSDSSIYW